MMVSSSLGGSRGGTASSSDQFSNCRLPTHDVEFYGRQLILSQIGVDGQLRLKSSRVIIVGAGGLGSSACLYLAGAGIGTKG